MRYLQSPNPQRNKVEWWLPGAEERGNRAEFNGTTFQFFEIKGFWRWLVLMAVQ
jgi:hypothetical protein